MKKNFFKYLLLGVFTLSLGAGFVGCKDYDDDIDDLWKAIEDIKKDITAIETEIQGGNYIDKVESTANGIKITMKGGAVYEITNGTSGTPGSVVTIGENGNWFIDGKDTELQAQGPAGPAGPAGSGDYYIPMEDGFWYKNGTEPENKTELKWKTQDYIYAVKGEDGIVRLFGVPGYPDGYALGAATKLTSLEFRSSAYYKGQPAIVFNTITYKAVTRAVNGTYSILAATEPTIITNTPVAEYHMNSNLVSKDSFVAEDMVFDLSINVPHYTRGTNPALTVTPKYKGITDGVLSVDVIADAGLINDGTVVNLPTEDYFDRVFLQVPLVGEEGEVVTSSEAVLHKVNIDDFDIAHANVALKRTSVLPGFIAGFPMQKPITGKYFFPTYVNAKLGVDADSDPTTIPAPETAKSYGYRPDTTLVYTSSLDMAGVVRTALHTEVTGDANYPYDVAGLDVDIEQFGFHYEFAVIKYVIGANQTDQAEYARLNGSILTSQVHGDEDHGAAIGKTPIIEVRLMNGTQIIKVAYVKVEIVREDVDPTEVTFNFNAVPLSCSNVLRPVTVEQMATQVYNVLSMSKADFHNTYTWQPADGATGNSGLVSEVTNPGTSTTNILNWTLRPVDLWNTTVMQNKEATYTGRYKHNTLDTYVDVKFVVPVNYPALAINNKDKYDAYWNSEDQFRQNVAVPAIGDANSANCTFVNNLYEGFVVYGSASTAAQAVGTIDWSKAAADYTTFTNLYDGLAVHYSFDASNNNVRVPVDGITYTLNVIDNGSFKNKILTAKIGNGAAQNVAIIDNAVTGLGTVASPVKYLMTYQETDHAKALLSSDAFTAVIASEAIGCNVATYKLPIGGEKGKFTVRFVNPVKVTPNDTGSWIDATSGGALVPVLDVITLKDWRGEPFEKWNEDNTVNANANLYGYYGVNLAADLGLSSGFAKATIRPVDGSTPVKDLHDNALSIFVGNSTTNPETVDGVLYYRYDNQGNPVTDKPYIVEFPAYVTHKWGKAFVNVSIVLNPVAGRR